MKHLGHLAASVLSAGTLCSAMAAKPKKANPPATANPAAAAAATPAASKIWDFKIKADDSVFAIVTQKTGVAATLAHNHLIAARQINADISANPEQLNSGKFTFKSKTGELEFDRKDLSKRWYPVIRELGWLNEPFSEIKDSDRETIREHALADDQLNVDKYPEISAQLINISDSPSQVGSKKFLKKANVSVTLHGQTVTREFAANISLQDQELTVEAVAEFRFTEFGIKPYRALMGALGNDDRFNMLVSFRAVKK